MKKITVLLLATALVCVVAYSQRASIATRLLETGLKARLGSNVIASFEDGLHLALCGAGGPLPAPNASGPCVAVVAGDRLFLVDAGTDGVRNLARMGYQPGSIEAVFLTHFHSDHIDGLGEVATLRWTSAGRKKPLPVFGPTGVEIVVKGFNLAYAQDVRYRNAHHGDSVADLAGAGMVAIAFPKPELGEFRTVLEDNDLKIEALTVQHDPVDPAVGYRFTYKDRSLLITGDTAKSANIAELGKGVDLLVHEALAPNLVNMMHVAAKANGNEIMAKITHDILDYHTSPVEAAETARDAQAGHLLYYHIVPPLIVPGQKTLFLNGAQDIFSDYTIGEDGVAFSLPTGSDDIIQTSRGL